MALYIFPHSSIESRIGFRDCPSSLSAYSTRGGTSGYTVRVISPSSSMERRLSVRTFWLMPSRFFFSSLKRHGRYSRFRIISNFHLLPIKATVVATGHSGNSSFVSIVSTPYHRRTAGWPTSGRIGWQTCGSARWSGTGITTVFKNAVNVS